MTHPKLQVVTVMAGPVLKQPHTPSAPHFSSQHIPGASACTDAEHANADTVL